MTQTARLLLSVHGVKTQWFDKISCKINTGEAIHIGLPGFLLDGMRNFTQ